jgi:hypothetical protein
MTETQARRTLVKSPPELWAELSDPAALARHLGELGGEIRITRTEPEKTVVWEGERTSGTVELEPSGWGTKVTLTLRSEQQPPMPDAGDGAPPAAGAPEAVVPAAAEAVAPAAAEAVVPAAAEAVAPPPPEPQPEPQPEPEPVPETEPEPAAVVAEAPPATVDETPTVPATPARVGFFSRLFGRRRAPVAAVPEPAPIQEERPAPQPPQPPKPEAAIPAPRAAPIAPPAPPPIAPPAPPPIAPPPPPPAVAAETAAPTPEPEPQAAPEAKPDDDDTADLLGTVLDSLGSAHHRPFSRS